MAFLAAIPAWVSYAAAAVSAASAIASSQTQAKQMEENAKINENNALLFTAQATEAERKQRQELEAVRARQRAAIGKSGVTMSGTPLLVDEDMTATGELDALTIRYNGAMKAKDQRYQAAVNRYQAGQTRTAGYLKAAASVFGAAAGAAGSAGSTAGNGLSATTSTSTGMGLSMGSSSGITVNSSNWIATGGGGY